MSKFVETKTVTTTTIKSTVDGKLPNCADISVVSNGHGVELVIGAPFDKRKACYFQKSSLKTLIEELNEIHDAMEYPYDL